MDLDLVLSGMPYRYFVSKQDSLFSRVQVTLPLLLTILLLPHSSDVAGYINPNSLRRIDSK